MSDGSDFFKESLSYKIPVDYMLVYGRKRQSVQTLMNMYSFDNLIIGSDVPFYLTTELIEEATEFGIKYCEIRENGAYLVE